jgi:hypothetical protein
MLTPKRFRGDQAAGLLYAGDIGSHGDEVRRLFRDSQVGGSGLCYLYQLAAAAGWSSLPFLGLIRQPVLVSPCYGWRCRSDRSGRECTDPGWPHSGRDPVCLQRWSCRTAGRSTGFRAGDQPIRVAGAAVSFVRLAVRTSSRARPVTRTPPGPHGRQSGGPARTGGPRNQQGGHARQFRDCRHCAGDPNRRCHPRRAGRPHAVRLGLLRHVWSGVRFRVVEPSGFLFSRAGRVQAWGGARCGVQRRGSVRDG